MKARRIERGRIAVEHIPGVGWRTLVRVIVGEKYRWIPTTRANDGHRALIEHATMTKGAK